MKNLKNLKKPKGALEDQQTIERRARRIFAVFACLMLSMAVMTVPALAAPAAAGAGTAAAATDPLTIVQKLSDFIFSLIRSVGLILLGFGILQLGLSLKSHDPSQRANGILTIAGGIVITFTKEILTLITN